MCSGVSFQHYSLVHSQKRAQTQRLGGDWERRVATLIKFMNGVAYSYLYMNKEMTIQVRTMTTGVKTKEEVRRAWFPKLKWRMMIRRGLHNQNRRGFIRVQSKQTKKWKELLGKRSMKLKSVSVKMMERGKCRGKRDSSWSTATVKQGGGCFMAPTGMTVNRVGSAAFITDFTADGSEGINTEGQRRCLWSDSVTCIRAYWMIWAMQPKTQ